MPIDSFRSLLKQALHLKESPQRTALAFAIGAAIAFCPFYGFHMILVGFCTWAFRMNFVALMAGALINNPWTVVPILGLTYWTGALLTGTAESPSFNWNDLSFAGIYAQVMPYAVPFTLGGIVLSTLGALLAYPISLALIRRHRRQHAVDSAEPLPPPEPLR